MTMPTTATNLRHVPFTGPRNLIGEQVFAAEWKVLMEGEPDEDDLTPLDVVANCFRRRLLQHHAHLAATFITWLGTNVGGCYLASAKKRDDGRYSFLAQWAIENHRTVWVNHGWRTIEYFLHHGSWNDAERKSPPRVRATDLELVEHVAAWLGTEPGREFLARCERIIYARNKGLSDYDLVQLGVTK